MRYAVLSIDLDGTLVDTAAEIAHAANATLIEFGLSPRRLADITRLIGGGARELMLRLLAEASGHKGGALRCPADVVLERFDHHYALAAGTIARPYAGCRRSLERLRDAGVRVVCITNKEHRFAHRVLCAAGLDGFFELLIGGDSLPRKKPHRSVIDHALQRLQCRHEAAAHIGDSRIDIETARNAGVAAWAVPYGYNAGEPIDATRPDRVFRELADVADHVITANARHAAAGSTTR